MSISTEELRRLLLSPPTRDIAAVLKEWRAHHGFSQADAAVRLGIPVRTLQGWEAGRPMPYPSLLQQPIDITARANGDFGFVQSQFPREFASFIDFVGPERLDKTLAKVARKLGTLSVSVRALYRDRFYFHEQWGAFTDGPNAFHLDLRDLRAVRAATLIAGVNKIRQTLSQKGSDRLRSMLLDNLQPDRDVRQLEHEIRCYAHFTRKRYPTRFADLEELGRFDLLVETPSGPIEVECKTVTEDTGNQIKTDMTVDLSETFRQRVLKSPPVQESGVFELTFDKPTSVCRHVGSQLRDALGPDGATSDAKRDFSLRFVPRTDWQALLEAGNFEEFRRRVAGDPKLSENAHCIVKADRLVLGLILIPHKPPTISARVVDTIQAGASQCSGSRSAVVWLHFIGLAEREFVKLAQFSSDGRGAGLNALVADALHPKASATDRSHVERILFSAIPDELTRQPAFGPTLLLEESVSLGGKVYDVPNPFCKFSSNADL
ncbi:hypothetical protein ABID59_000198 [Bradyrhizobium sp. S3.3.6]|uniref:helix-turn-helix domain-containing protein n=1 Tax=Bradyrhizobium sp. S3.3.6 TaxID=3156429 RepID=UPI003393BA75